MMARFSIVASLALFASAATAFVTPFVPRLGVCSVSSAKSSSTTRMMSTVEPPTAEQLRQMAQACQDDGCSVEAVTTLLEQLKAKKKELETQLVTVDDVLLMMGDSSVMGEKTEVEKLVMAIGRLFSVGDDDYPYLPYPTGYSGDINKEKKDAWDYNVNSQLKPRKPLYN